ncbi:hypothetical protein KM043_017868 [Ampulex compressa]|nr:hypothetical protein KM043_017868 [Ampulex compressa]
MRTRTGRIGRKRENGKRETTRGGGEWQWPGVYQRSVVGARGEQQAIRMCSGCFGLSVRLSVVCLGTPSKCIAVWPRLEAEKKSRRKGKSQSRSRTGAVSRVAGSAAARKSDGFATALDNYDHGHRGDDDDTTVVTKPVVVVVAMVMVWWCGDGSDGGGDSGNGGEMGKSIGRERDRGAIGGRGKKERMDEEEKRRSRKKEEVPPPLATRRTRGARHGRSPPVGFRNTSTESSKSVVAPNRG